ncbi:MAG: WG repeat-containing protein [Bacteroidales bacterium]|nr:WG repeat-containing protein [Bacteroidales bacterium]
MNSFDMNNLTLFQDPSTYQFGFKDEEGNVVIDAVYDSCMEFSEGLAACSVNGKWGFIDERGKRVIAFDYFRVGSFKHGVAAINRNNSWGYINKEGKYVIKPVFSLANDFIKDRDGNINAIVAKPDGCEMREYVIDADGKVVDKL